MKNLIRDVENVLNVIPHETRKTFKFNTVIL